MAGTRCRTVIALVCVSMIFVLSSVVATHAGSLQGSSVGFIQNAMGPSLKVASGQGNSNFVSRKPAVLVGLGLRSHGRHTGAGGHRQRPTAAHKVLMTAQGAEQNSANDASFESMPIPELRKTLKDKGLSTAGNKKQLMQRLKEASSMAAPSSPSENEAAAVVRGFEKPSAEIAKVTVPSQAGFGSSGFGSKAKPGQAQGKSGGFAKKQVANDVTSQTTEPIVAPDLKPSPAAGKNEVMEASASQSHTPAVPVEMKAASTTADQASIKPVSIDQPQASGIKVINEKQADIASSGSKQSDQAPTSASAEGKASKKAQVRL
jgi:hypothetical protein